MRRKPTSTEVLGELIRADDQPDAIVDLLLRDLDICARLVEFP